MTRSGEKQEQAVIVESPAGRGVLYVTTIGLILEIHGRGIYMDLRHEFITSVINTNRNKVVVSWIENKKDSFSFEFRTDKAGEFAKAVSEKHNYSANFSDDHEGHPVDLTGDVKEMIRQCRLEPYNHKLEPLEQKLSEIQSQLDNLSGREYVEIGEQKVALDYQKEPLIKEIDAIKQQRKTIEEMPIIRSSVIPKEVDSVNVWNDCYYDTSRKAYITFNKRFEQMKEARTRDIQVQFDKEMGKESGIIIEESKITIKYGISAIIAKDQDGNPVWHLLPIMTDEMLTDEIVTNRLWSKSDDESVLYETVSEAWLSMGTKGLMLTEREREVGVKRGTYADVPMEQLKLINHRK
ncbi:hypothetical protein [Nitrosopumilus ureiphilus]|uniref:hypothetical protein n=1 Tax=Nitrosopumilus ureiphilus TaxID=1470067 RepID=UPI0015CD523A|nr:hypothetical protein [Nitrosopumilus ureiphilus]